MATRTQARELVVELLYAYTMGNERIFDFADELLSAKKIRNAQADFAKGLFKGILAHLQNIDSIIEANLKSWELSRLGVIDKCILRLGVYEILKGEIDAPVAINEAIEIAKILGAENTGKFVNGVLDAIRKQNLGNSSLELHSADSANFGRSQTISLVSRPKFAENHESQTENPSVVDSLHESKNKKKPSLRGKSMDSPKQSKNKSIARSATKSRQIRGAKKQGESKIKNAHSTNRTKNAKSAPFRHSEGAKRPKNPRIASKSFLDSSPTAKNDGIEFHKPTQRNKKPTNRTHNKNIKSPKSTQKTNANSSIVDEKSGLRSHEQGNRTNNSLTKRVASLPDLSPQDEFAKDAK